MTNQTSHSVIVLFNTNVFSVAWNVHSYVAQRLNNVSNSAQVQFLNGPLMYIKNNDSRRNQGTKNKISTLESVGLYWPSASIRIIPGDECKLKTGVQVRLCETMKPTSSTSWKKMAHNNVIIMIMIIGIVIIISQQSQSENHPVCMESSHFVNVLSVQRLLRPGRCSAGWQSVLPSVHIHCMYILLNVLGH